ncbi:PadR family transcriptional regulator [Sphaerisporangium corydalis]|uniref:PadR family transcriptional regulator n=1 Tax=Sphaerisporangium corydalis TaxID=1441875 RepID=A0ABV9EB52_9ACTN|nr:PadR family transcriptional regulator [Sphaerisporangium corydalis]
MAKRRRVGNLLGLAVLSAVVFEPMHPYEMASVLRERGKEQDMDIKWGSLYTVVRNLEKHGLIEATGNTRQGGRPERTVYRITDAGRAEMEDWVRELLSTPDREHPRFAAGLSVWGVLPPDEITTLLRRRLDLLEASGAEQRESLERYGREIPRLFLVEVEYDLAIREAEATWIRALVEELTSGSFPGLKEWRDWHRTGRLPAGIAALAERGGKEG